MSEKYRALVVGVLKGLNLLDASGALVMIDSLRIIEIVSRLEDEGNLSIPTAALTVEAFESVDSIAAMLAGLEAQ